MLKEALKRFKAVALADLGQATVVGYRLVEVSGSRGTSLPPSPLRTGRASFPTSRLKQMTNHTGTLMFTL
jgi:hypothetical protein